MKQKPKELKKEIDNSTVITKDFNTIFIMNRTTRQKINKVMEDWNNTINLLELTDTYRPHHTTTTEQLW